LGSWLEITAKFEKTDVTSISSIELFREYPFRSPV